VNARAKPIAAINPVILYLIQSSLRSARAVLKAYGRIKTRQRTHHVPAFSGALINGLI
jgi:hypothetical protein